MILVSLKLPPISGGYHPFLILPLYLLLLLSLHPLLLPLLLCPAQPPHPLAPAGSVGQLVPAEQMVRNAASSKERRRGAFIMRIQLNPGNGQCGEERGHQMQTKPVAVAEENASNLWSTRSTQSREPRYGWDLENWVDELVGQSLESIQVTPLRTKLFCGIGEGVIPKYPLLGFCKPSLRWPGTANKPICYQLGQSVKNGPI